MQQRYGYAQHRADAGDNRGGGRREKEPSASVMIRGLKPTTSAEMVCRKNEWERRDVRHGE